MQSVLAREGNLFLQGARILFLAILTLNTADKSLLWNSCLGTTLTVHYQNKIVKHREKLSYWVLSYNLNVGQCKILQIHNSRLIYTTEYR